MKKNVLFVLFLFVLIISSCSPKYTHVTYEEHSQITNKTRNVDGTRVLLLVDSIPFDSLQFEIIGNKQKRRYFYVPVGYLDIDKTIKDKEVLNANYGIVHFCLSSKEYKRLYERLYGISFQDEDADGNSMSYEHTNKKGWSKCVFRVPPSFMRVYMIRGIDYNVLFCSAFDSNRTFYHFPHMRSYYKVFVPVWK